MFKYRYPDELISRALPSIKDDERKILEEKYLEILSEEQAIVALHRDGPLMVIAGPGSGKTETMVRRVAILLDFYGVSPEEIAITTFTEKASASLLNRLKSRVKKPEQIEKLTVGTIHSFCLTLLEEYGVRFGLFKRSIRVLDEHRLSLFIYNNFKTLTLDEHYDRPSGQNIAAIKSYYSSFLEKGCDIEKILLSVDCDEKQNQDLVIAAKTFDKYKELLNTSNAVDFSTILTKTVDLLEIPEALKEIQDRYKYLIIDEYQDTNPIQDMILRKVAEPQNNIAVIGDDDQSIYRFRGATVTNFLSFDKNFKNCSTYYINENRRSTSSVVDFSRLIVGKIPHSARKEKSITTKNERGEPVFVNEYETNQDEIRAIADKIENLKNSGAISNWSDVAILNYSISSIYSELDLEFSGRGIPLKTKGDKSYLSEPAVTSLISAIEFITKKKKTILDLKLLKRPIFDFLNPSTEEFINNFISEEDIIDVPSSNILITSPDDKRRVMKLIALRKEVIGSNYNSKSYSDLLDLVFKVLMECETIKFLSTDNSEESDNILNQIGMFTELLSDYSNETGRRSFSDFKNFIQYIIDNSIDTPNNEDVDDAVILQTIHQSKGLEYPVVFIPAMTDRRFPGSERSKNPLPMIAEVYKYWKPNPDIENHDIDFRRLFYVAITRAEKLVFISYFKKISQNQKISRYLAELVADNKIQIKTEIVPTETRISSKHNHKDKLKISSSHLQYYVYCPTRYKYNLKHSIQAPHRGYFSFGSSLHSMIEEATNLVKSKDQTKITPAQLKEIFDNNWTNFGFENVSAAERQKEHAWKYLNNFCGTHVPLMKHISMSEKKFTLEESNFILTGKIDALVEKDNNIIVVDFKTGKKDKFEKEPESTFVENQANIYVEAAERLGLPTPSEFYLHFLGENQTDLNSYKMPFGVTKDSRNQIIDLLSDTADRILKRDFAPASEEHRSQRCSRCEYRKVCPFKIIDNAKVDEAA